MKNYPLLQRGSIYKQIHITHLYYNDSKLLLIFKCQNTKEDHLTRIRATIQKRQLHPSELRHTSYPSSRGILMNGLRGQAKFSELLAKFQKPNTPSNHQVCYLPTRLIMMIILPGAKNNSMPIAFSAEKQVQKKNDEIQNLANHLNRQNTKKTFFSGWKQYTDRKKELRKMEQKADKYQKHRVLKSIMKSWLEMTMESNKTKIKNEVLQKTEIEVSRIQVEYQRLIKSLQETLQKKLSELKKQQEEHKILHDKYQAMYSRAPVEQASSR